jgi:hypothetical protein
MGDNQLTSPLQRVTINDKMVDKSPPPKETDPLRNRIAVFEKQYSDSNTSSKPPPIRPKPGKISWTQKQPSLPPSPSNQGKELDALAKSSTSAADAQEGIGERVAGLDGKSGFGPEFLNLDDQEGRRRAEVAARMHSIRGVRIWRDLRGIGPGPSLGQRGVPQEDTKPGTPLIYSQVDHR